MGANETGLRAREPRPLCAGYGRPGEVSSLTFICRLPVPISGWFLAAFPTRGLDHSFRRVIPCPHPHATILSAWSGSRRL